MLKIALTDYFREHTDYLKKMVAAYVLGFSITTGFDVHRPGLADARLDVERGVVVCTTLADQYVGPLAPGMDPPFGPASLHNMDYPAFWENIRENVRVRVHAYMEKRN